MVSSFICETHVTSFIFREKLRENEQQKKIVPDHPVTETYNIDKDREIEKLKRMNERLKLEKEEIERR